MGTQSSSTLKCRMGSQWSQIKTQQQTFIKNNYTEQQFLLHSITNIEQKGGKLYFLREFSTFPYTPKVICVQKQQSRLILLVQRPQQLLSKWLQRVGCQLAMLMKLHDVLCGMNTLKSKFGGFIVSERMIQLSVHDNVILWYNEKFHSNIVQLPLCKSETRTGVSEDECVMVQNIMQIFRKNQNFSTLLYPTIKGVQSFAQLRIAVKRRIRQLQKTTSPIIDSSHKRNSVYEQKVEGNSHRQRKKHLRKPSIELNKKRPQTSTPTQFTSKTSSSIPAKGRNKCFLLEETQKLQQNHFIQQFNYCQTKKRNSTYNQRLYDTSNDIEASSSQRGQDSNGSSNQFIKENTVKKDTFRPWKSFHQTTFKLNLPEEVDMFRKKQCGYTNLAIYQVNEKQNKKQTSVKQVHGQQSRQLYVSPSFRTISSNHGYKPYQSFSSTKPLSLKSTTGTLKKTREFNETMFCQLLIGKRQTIKEESDENYKNSNNYSVETIKEEQKEEQKQQSLTVSQDFNQLFSARQSNECDQQNEKRQIQFEQILWGGE